MKLSVTNLSFALAIMVLSLSCNSKKKKDGDNGILLSADGKCSEMYHPQFHFTPDSMWMNDPNGMVFFDGEYHLFYQYYPDSTVWGPMHWGHAVSKDLVRWEHLPIALYPDSLGYIFSGSAVVDWHNTTGFGSKENPPMVAIYTYHDPVGAEEGKIDYQTQGIAYSLDKGRTWTKYELNPVLNNPGIIDFRDPKVRWYEPDQKWIMTLAVKDRISFYSSKNLLEWKHESDFQSDIGAYGGVWECPDLFPLTSQNSKEEKWVLFVSINPGAPNGGSGTQYFVGTFDGQSFKNENSELYWIDYGKDNYAGVTWSDIPESDARCIFIGWMSNWQYAQIVPTENWRSAMTFPRELALHKDGDNFKIYSKPVKEIENIQTHKETLASTKVDDKGQINLKLPFDGTPQELLFSVSNQSGEILKPFSINFKNDLNQKISIHYNPEGQTLSVNRDKSGETSFSEDFTGTHTAPFQNKKSDITFRVLLDVSSIELFINDGELVMTEIFFPDEPFNLFELNCSENLELSEFTSYKLQCIW